MCTNKTKFFKSVGTLLLTCLLAVLPSGAMAQETFTVDGLAYTVVEGSTTECLVSTYQDESLSGEISIPEMVQFEGLSYIVVGLESRAFVCCEKITSVAIPNSVKSIGEFAFDGCSSLTSIVIPKSVTYIGSGAFSACHSLKSIEVEEGNSVYDSRGNCNAIVQTASNVLVHGCSATKIPESVISIGKHAFYDCSSLTSITLPKSVRNIQNGAFSYCSSLTSIMLPKNLTHIGESVFMDCSSLASIVIPKSVTYIGSDAFSACHSLKSIEVEEGNSVYDSRGNCNAIVQTASNALVHGCSATKIPESVISIGKHAFYDCSSLTSITLPKSVRNIQNGAFSYCSSLTSVTLPESLTYIDDSAFNGCTSLASITLPETLSHIGNSAFNNCSSLTSITLPESLISILGCVFSNCSSLTNVTLPKSLKKIEASMFAHCSSLTSIILPESVISIGMYAFNRCSSLTSIILPETVSNIEWQAFFGCSSLKEITCLALTPPSEERAFDSLDTPNITVYVPQESVVAYKTADTWKEFNIVGIDATGIESMKPENGTPAAIYSLDGKKVSETQKGRIYLHRYGNGKTVKRMAK